MNILLFGMHAETIKSLVENLGFSLVQKDPDVVISYGGDGTLLSSERGYPGIPKLPIRNSQFCNKCSNHTDEILLKNLSDGKLKVKEYKKLQTDFSGKTLLALNDFVIRNKEATHAIRFKVHDKLLVGDGIVVATPFGSSGYFKSITGQTFNSGFGLAFNNTTEKQKPIIFDEKDQVQFKLIRGNAIFTIDNSPHIYPVAEQSTIIFSLSDQTAKIYELETLRCNICQVQR